MATIRTPPPIDDAQRSAQQSESNCELCEQPDDAEDMVACDHCKKWYHFQCAYVGEDVANVSWSCPACTATTAAPASKTACSRHPLHKSAASSKIQSHYSSQKSSASSAKRREVILQQLADEKALAEETAAKKLELAAEQLQQERAMAAKQLEQEKAMAAKQLEL